MLGADIRLDKTAWAQNEIDIALMELEAAIVAEEKDIDVFANELFFAPYGRIRRYLLVDLEDFVNVVYPGSIATKKKATKVLGEWWTANRHGVSWDNETQQLKLRR